jgi:hypothetical protein
MDVPTIDDAQKRVHVNDCKWSVAAMEAFASNRNSRPLGLAASMERLP